MNTDELNNPMPKRGKGRPKGSKDKVKRKKASDSEVKHVVIERVFVNPPKVPIYWRIKRMTWLLRNIEKHLQDDPTYITPTAYFSLVKDLEEAYNQIEEKGLATREQRVLHRKRVEQSRLGKDGEPVRSSRVGEDERSGLGARVSAANPLGRKG